MFETTIALTVTAVILLAVLFDDGQKVAQWITKSIESTQKR